MVAERKPTWKETEGFKEIREGRRKGKRFRGKWSRVKLSC